MMDWLIVYSDGSTFSSDDGAWEDAPGWDAQIVVEENETVGRKLHCRNDFFVMIDGRPINVDFIGLMDYLANVLGIVKVGRMLPSEQFRALVHQATIAEGLPRKSAWLPDEPRVRPE